MPRTVRSRLTITILPTTLVAACFLYLNFWTWLKTPGYLSPAPFETNGWPLWFRYSSETGWEFGQAMLLDAALALATTMGAATFVWRHSSEVTRIHFSLKTFIAAVSTIATIVWTCSLEFGYLSKYGTPGSWAFQLAEYVPRPIIAIAVLLTWLTIFDLFQVSYRHYRR